MKESFLLPVTGRVLAKLNTAYDPYCIARVVRIDESLEGRCVQIWFSLHKGSSVLKKEESCNFDLNRHPVKVTFLGFRNSQALLEFEWDEANVTVQRQGDRPSKENY